MAAQSSPKTDREHGDVSTIHSLHRERHCIVLAPRAEDVEEGEVVIGSGDGKHGVAAELFVSDQRGIVASKHQLAGALLESQRPVERLDRMSSPGEGVQVMHDVPAANEENILLAQCAQPLAGLVVKLRRLRLVDAELYDWNVRLRKDVTENRPRSVIEAPVLIELDVDRREEGPDPFG